MYSLISQFSTYSIALGVIFGWVRIKRVLPTYLPFLIILTLGLVNEQISFFLIKSGHSNAVNGNIYSFIESLLLLWQLKQWGLLRHAPRFFYFIGALYIVVWCTENVIYFRPAKFSSFFNATYAFCTVLMSISLINLLMGNDQGSLLKNPIFIFCTGMVIYYTYVVVIELFYLYGLGSSKEFRRNLYYVHTYINLLSNLIYAAAFLWIPRKREFIQL